MLWVSILTTNNKCVLGWIQANFKILTWTKESVSLNIEHWIYQTLAHVNCKKKN